MKKFLIFAVSCLILMAMCACEPISTGSTDLSESVDSSKTAESLESTESIESVDSKPDESSKVLTFNSTILFDDLEIVIGNQIKWVKVDNQFSENNGADVAEVPVTIKNVSDKTHGLNMFYYKFYGPDGNELDDVSTYFDNDAYSAGDMRSGATQNTYFHILYKGNGDYYVEFSAFSDPIEVKLPIKK